VCPEVGQILETDTRAHRRELRAERSHAFLPGVEDAARAGPPDSQGRARPDETTREDYRRGEKAAGINSLFSCRTARTPDCGGHWPSFRDSSRMRLRSFESL